METKRDCHSCQSTNLPSGPGVVKTRWLKANVRSYVELSSAIREGFLPTSWLQQRQEGKKGASQEGATQTIQPKNALVDGGSIKTVLEWRVRDMVKRLKDSQTIKMSNGFKKPHADHAVTGQIVSNAPISTTPRRHRGLNNSYSRHLALAAIWRPHVLSSSRALETKQPKIVQNTKRCLYLPANYLSFSFLIYFHLSLLTSEKILFHRPFVLSLPSWHGLRTTLGRLMLGFMEGSFTVLIHFPFYSK